MEPPAVLVVGETPSLGRSITDLLETGGFRAEYVPDLHGQGPLDTIASRYAVVVAACNAPYCTTAREWLRGTIPNIALVVVGARDPALAATGNLHLVPLPLLPARFLGLIRGLLEATSRSYASSARTV